MKRIHHYESELAMTRQTIDINADAGESFGRWVLGADSDVLPWVTTVNIACGFHAGDPANMRKAVQLARELGVNVGAHPGYPDLWGFGRRAMALSDQSVLDYVAYQTGALLALANAEGVPMTHMKPHGSLYGHIARSPELALALTRELQKIQPGLALLTSPFAGGYAVRAAGLPVVFDAPADLDFEQDGTHVIEPIPQAKDPLKVADRAAQLAGGKVTSVSGVIIDMPTESICVHGDRPNAPAVAKAVHERLTAEGYTVTSAFARV